VDYNYRLTGEQLPDLESTSAIADDRLTAAAARLKSQGVDQPDFGADVVSFPVDGPGDLADVCPAAVGIAACKPKTRL